MLGPMRRAWGWVLLLLLLPGCLTRSLWLREHRERCCWAAETVLELERSDDGGERPVVVMDWPGPEDWRRHEVRHTLPTPAVIGLPASTTQVELLPRQWPETLVTVLSPPAGSPTESVASCASLTVVLGDGEAELWLLLSGGDAASETAWSGLPGIADERFCFTCGASWKTLRDRARLVAVASPADSQRGPSHGIPTDVWLVERTPVGLGEKLVLTPFAAAADLVLLPLELLTIRVWWGD